jgi:hypothetical protein
VLIDEAWRLQTYFCCCGLDWGFAHCVSRNCRRYPAPAGEAFSELYLLDPGQLAQNYPSNIAVGSNYSVYVNVGNHLGSSAYYVIYVKLANDTNQLPNTTLGTPSPLPPLYEYRFSIKDSANWQSLLRFSASSASISANNSQISTRQ